MTKDKAVVGDHHHRESDSLEPDCRTNLCFIRRCSYNGLETNGPSSCPIWKQVGTLHRVLHGRTDNAIENHWNSMLERKCSSMSEELSSDVQAHPPHKRSASVQIRFDLGDLGSLTKFNLGDFSLHGGVSPASQVFTCKFSTDRIQRSKPLQSEQGRFREMSRRALLDPLHREDVSSMNGEEYSLDVSFELLAVDADFVRRLVAQQQLTLPRFEKNRVSFSSFIFHRREIWRVPEESCCCGRRLRCAACGYHKNFHRREVETVCECSSPSSNGA
ncbi:hypothetical protein ACFX11_013090 [Malus domestica]